GPEATTTASASRPAHQHSDNRNPGKTTICHHTGSAKNPWVRITIADRALKAHARHGDQIPAPSGGCPVAATSAAESPAPSTTAAPASEEGGGLPYTGFAAWLIALAGATALLAGVTFRRLAVRRTAPGPRG